MVKKSKTTSKLGKKLARKAASTLSAATKKKKSTVSVSIRNSLGAYTTKDSLHKQYDQKECVDVERWAKEGIVFNTIKLSLKLHEINELQHEVSQLAKSLNKKAKQHASQDFNCTSLEDKKLLYDAHEKARTV